MFQIPVDSLPSQELAVELDGSRYVLRLFSAAGLMFMDITRDEQVVILAAKCLPNQRIIPFRYLESGNFFFETPNDEYPDYTKFGDTHLLFFVTQGELDGD